MNGIPINIDPVIIHLGGFALSWYSLTFAGGIVLAVVLTFFGARAAGLNVDKVSNVAFWAVAGGLIGARAFHVIDRLDFYLANPAEIIMVNHGGLAIWGGLATGGLAALLAAIHEKLPIGKTADIMAVGLIAGQMVGRIGCIVNGDAYGGPTSLPWGFIYQNPHALIPDYLKNIPTHPYPVYEMLWDGAVLGLLLILRKRNLPSGMVFWTYVGAYAMGRFVLTFVRQETIVVAGLQQAQVIALGGIIAAIVATAFLVKGRVGAGARTA